MIKAIKTHLFSSFFFMILLILLAACVPQPKQRFDYNAEQQKSLEQLRKMNTLFMGMEGVDVVLYLSKEDFSDVVSQSFDRFVEHFSHLDAAGFSDVSFGHLKIELLGQSIVSEVAFSLEIDALKRKIFGHVRSHHTLSAGKDEFVLSTTFDEIVLDGFDLSEAPEENSENRQIIATSVKGFLHMLNGEILNAPLNIPVDMNILQNINGRDIFASRDHTLHSAKSVNVPTKMKAYLPYVCEKGVAFIGASNVNKVSGRDNQPVDDMHLHESLKAGIDRELREKMGISLDTLQKHSSYYASKSYLARQMNYALEHTDLRLIKKFFLSIDESDQNMSKEIYFFNKGSLPACEGVKEDCSSRLKTCQRQCSKTYGIHSCQQCAGITNPFSHVRCMSALEKCKTKEELHLYECHKRENRCEEENLQIRNRCEIENLEKVAVCKEKKEELVFEDDHLLLTALHVSFDIANSYLVQKVGNIRFDETLSSLEVKREIHLSVDSRVELALKGTHSPDVNCSLGMREALLTHSVFDTAQESKTLPLLSQRRTDGTLMLISVDTASFLDVRLNNTPYERLLGRDDFSLECSYQGMDLSPIKAEKLLRREEIPSELAAMFSEITLEFDEESFTFPISPVKIAEDIYLYPTMEKQAIGFSRQAHFY